jgi:phosphopantetheine--protein transferase-like protein
MMTRDGSDRIIDYFAASSCDLTPASAYHAARVLYVPVSHDPEVTRCCASVLSQAELRRADRYASHRDKTLFTQRRAFRRFCGARALRSSQPLSHIDFKETDNGRPHLSDSGNFRFSFSSCRFGFVGAWSSTHGIGVDFEDQTRDLKAVKIARQFFSGAEASAVEAANGPEQLRTFFQIWTLKEAALKSIGEGLPFGLDRFEFELEPNPRVIHTPDGHGEPEQFNVHVIEGTGSCAAIVIQSLA